MAVREIIEIGHPLLAERVPEIPVAEINSAPVQQCIDDLIDTMRDANGAGIAANQVALPFRVFIAEVKGTNPRYPYKPKIPLTIVVNPEIEFLSDKTFQNYEGCLSVPNLRGAVDRHLEIRMRGYDRTGTPLEFDVRGYSAGTFQHEFDHLDGILFPHRVTDSSTFCSEASFAAFRQEEFAQQVKALVDTWGT